ncbi:hypothetical protein Leryth_021184 [Lithospermum erythrorhizon]|nr:hypothetical protein Leryth_021184 [Lithospermum erythrorhizon]
MFTMDLLVAISILHMYTMALVCWGFKHLWVPIILMTTIMLLQKIQVIVFNMKLWNPNFPSLLYKYTFNMKTGETSQKQLFRTPCDFPKINQSYIGKRSRYLYTSECDHLAKITSIVKSDLERSLELKLQFGDNKYGSEVAFVSRQLDSPSAEDDGYLTTFVHDEEKSVSFAYVITHEKCSWLAMM